MLFLSLLPLILPLSGFSFSGRLEGGQGLFPPFSRLMHITAGVALPSIQAKLSIYCALFYTICLYSTISIHFTVMLKNETRMHCAASLGWLMLISIHAGDFSCLITR